jgi:NAD(P)-dependent dehydrogenase (short-subunit alcohol dehydrogenase family)
MELFSLKERVAIITGGSRGIGKSIALALSDAGANVVVAARNKDLLCKVVEEIQGRGGKGFAMECNLLNDLDLFNLVAQTVEQYRRLDILVNNAGISPFVKKSEEVTQEEWEKVIRINLTVPFLLSREAGKIMMKHNWGRIINISSVGGLVGFPRQIAYCVAKGGLLQMTRVLAIEWTQKYNITVNAIAPGYITTDLTEGIRASEKISGNLLQRTPIRRFGEPNEVAGAVLYLASESSSYTTGTVLVVDGGWMAS